MRRRLVNPNGRLWVLVLVVLAVLTAAVSALAYWTAPGSGTATGTTGTLTKATITTHTATANSVALAWGAVSPPAGASVDGYYVLRNGSAADIACGSAALPITGTSCTDTAPNSSSPVTYSYTVVTKWRSWTSTSAAVSALVKGNQTITFTSTPPANGKVETTYAVTATGGGSGNPVTFTIDATTSSVCSISGSTLIFTTLGTCKVDANQAGNANYNAAPQAQQSITVNTKGDQIITFGALAERRLDQSPFTVSATGGGSGNAVTFSSATSAVCTVSGTSVTLVKTGTCTINANQAGNGNWNAAPQVPQSFTVNKGNQMITFGALANKTFDEGSVTVTATASSGLAATFTSETTGVCTAGGTNGATITFVAVGTCTINANQVGNTNWNAAPQVQQSFAVYGGAVAGLAFANITVGGESRTPTCTGTIGTTYSCTVPKGTMNNTALSASVVFVNSSAVATVFSSVQETVNCAYVGKTGTEGPATVNILGSQTTSSAPCHVQREGSKQAQITVTFSVPGGGTWTAVLATA
ncbi:MAG TPA: hypothetical protein VHS55_05620 [Solirubrobacteraceae bacterium]|nr:hypothetical protein [Solirubrobacteraceae bacterium]